MVQKVNNNDDRPQNCSNRADNLCERYNFLIGKERNRSQSIKEESEVSWMHKFHHNENRITKKITPSGNAATRSIITLSTMNDSEAYACLGQHLFVSAAFWCQQWRCVV
eukprot:scaffold67_cov180-Ochromonas_danica.AAC.7